MGENAWKGEPRRHARAAKKGWRKRRRRRGGGRRRSAHRRRTTRRCPPCRYKRGQFKGGLRRNQAQLENAGLLANAGLLENATSPFTGAGLARYGTAAAGVAVGLLVADIVDRVIATRKPKDGKNPWYGADAAAAYNRRPDAWRLGSQVVGGVLALGLAYWTRGRGIIPWLSSGIALGFGSNALLKLANWYLMPAILKVKDPTEKSKANRLYPMEQDSVQKEIDKAFENYASIPSLSEGQQGDASVVKSPLGDLSTSLYVLGAPEGKAQPHRDPAGTVGSGQTPRVFLKTNRLGHCSVCGGKNGCYSDCGTLCDTCGDHRPWSECVYEVEPNDDLVAMAAAGGVSVADVDAMNGSTSDVYWVVGNSVRLPYGMCLVVEQKKQGVMPQPVAPPPILPVAPLRETVVPVDTSLIAPPPPVMTASGPLAGPNGEKKSVVAKPKPPQAIGFWQGAFEDEAERLQEEA